MPIASNLRRAVVFLLTLTCANCGHFTPPAPQTAPVARDLPHESTVVLDPIVYQKARPGQDAVVALKRAENAVDANANRLRKSRIIYRGVRLRVKAGR